MVWIIFDLKNRSLAAAKALCQKKKNNNSLSKSSDAIWRCYYTQYIRPKKKRNDDDNNNNNNNNKREEEGGKGFFFGWYVRRPRDGETKFSPISFLFFVFYFYDSWRVPLFWIVFLLLLVYSFFFRFCALAKERSTRLKSLDRLTWWRMQQRKKAQTSFSF